MFKYFFLKQLSLACLTLVAFAALQAHAATPSSVHLDELSSVEVAQLLQSKTASSPAAVTTIIIPIGGTEQNGPHMALGKHNARVQVLAGKIATELANALVAPVVAYVPEGDISPPTGHMRFAGTISVPDAAFSAILRGAAASFRQHGFRHIVLLGDSGNYQQLLKEVAQDLNRDWSRPAGAAGAPAAQAHFIAEYYQSGQSAYAQALKARGITPVQMGTHAGLSDTALLMATKPSMVRPEQFKRAAVEGRSAGTSGDPRAASAELGQLGVDLIVKATVQAIRRVTQP